MPTEARGTSIVAPSIWWMPAMAFHTSWNAKLHENLLAFSDEWQAFVRRRISEDLRLLQRVGTAGNVEQLVGIYGKFWQQAVEDYAHEYAAITKLAGVGIMPDKSASQRPDDALEPPPHLSKAA